jgi:hypothetical protein
LYDLPPNYDEWLRKQRKSYHSENKKEDEEKHTTFSDIISDTDHSPDLVSSSEDSSDDDDQGSESETETNETNIPLTRSNSENAPCENLSCSDEQPNSDNEPVLTSSDDEDLSEESTGEDEAEVRGITAWAKDKNNKMIYKTYWVGWEEPTWEHSNIFRMDNYDKKRKSNYLKIYTDFLKIKKEKKLKVEEEIKLSDDDEDKEEETMEEEIITNAIVNRIKLLNIIAESKGGIEVPPTRKKALESAFWPSFAEAEMVEMQAFKDRGVWELVPRPRNRRVIGVRFVYDVKLDAVTGKVVRYKARLVAKGYAQIEGIDYTETFAPTMHIKTARTLLKKAAKHNIKAEHYDVSTAFLHATLQEQVYVEQPEGHIVEGKETWVYELRKAMYGLKNAPRAYSDHFQGTLQELGFKQASSDDCLWCLRKGKSWLYYLYYVDDILVVGNDECLNEMIFELLKTTLNIRKEGYLKQFLGMVIERRDDGSYTMEQGHYIRRIAEKFGVTSDLKKVNGPADVSVRLSVDDLPKTPEEKTKAKQLPYRELIGSLIYIAKTRLDVCYSLSDCSRFLQEWGQKHYDAGIRILTYLLQTADIKLIITKEDDLTLSIYCDANYGDSRDSGQKGVIGGKWRSQGGYIVYLGGTPIGWRSRRHKSTSLSSMESEYMEASEGGKEVVWFRRLMIDLDETQTKPTELYEDNKACYEFSKNNTCHDRTKHIDQRAYYLRELVKKGEIVVVPVGTKNQLADIMTKTQTYKLFNTQRDKIYSPERITVRRTKRQTFAHCPCLSCFCSLAKSKKKYAYVQFLSENI